MVSGKNTRSSIESCLTGKVGHWWPALFCCNALVADILYQVRLTDGERRNKSYLVFVGDAKNFWNR